MTTYASLPPQGNMAALLQENAELRKENAELRKENTVLKDRVKQLQLFIDWENKLFAMPSDDISDADKVIARILPTVVKKARERTAPADTREDGLTRVHLAAISELTGKSTDRVGANLKRMGEQGRIKRDFKRGSKRVKDKVTGEEFKINDNAVFIDVSPRQLIAQIPTAEPRNKGNGQKHYVCKDCHSTNTVVKRVYQVICKDCGSENYLDATKKEDKAFIIDGETAENFDEWYGDVDITDVEDVPGDTPAIVPLVEPIDITAIQARMAANARKLEEANRAPTPEEARRILDEIKRGHNEHTT